MAKNLGSSPGLRRSPEEENDNPLQGSCLENPHGEESLAGYSPWCHKESDTTERLALPRSFLDYQVGLVSAACDVSQLCMYT